MLGVSVARRHYDNRECLSGPLLGPEQGEDVTYVIGLPCVDVKDRACVEECPVDCIYEGERSLYIHPEECVDCGACEPCLLYTSDAADE